MCLAQLEPEKVQTYTPQCGHPLGPYCVKNGLLLRRLQPFYRYILTDSAKLFRTGSFRLLMGWRRGG